MARTGMANLIARLRPMLADEYKRRQDTATGDGTTNTYWLTHNPQAAGGTVAVGGTIQGTAAYSWDTINGRVALTSTPTNGTSVSVEYMTARFTDDQLQEFLDGCVTVVRDKPLTWMEETIGGGTVAWHDASIGYGDMEESSGGTTRWVVRDATGAVQGTSNYTVNYPAGLVRFTTTTGGTSYYVTGYSYDLNTAAADGWMRKAAELADSYQFQGDGQTFMRQQMFAQAKEMEAFYRRKAGQNITRGGLQTGVMVRTDVRGYGDVWSDNS